MNISAQLHYITFNLIKTFNSKNCIPSFFQCDISLMMFSSSLIRVIPVEPAMHLCLNRHPSVDPFWDMSTLRSYRTPTRPSTFESLRPRAARSSQISTSPISTQIPTSPCGTLKKKKQVVFADDKGLALTSVRFFDSDPLDTDEEEEPSSPVKIKTRSSVQSKTPRLRLGFPQPSTDLSSFLEGLNKSQVRLERCSLIYGSLFGKVRVRNISAEKAVHIRMTCDSWMSHQDMPCTPILQNRNAETEQFIFNIPVPSCTSVQNHLEFYITFRPGSGNLLFLDNNDGQNYRILVEDVDTEEVSVETTPLNPQNIQSIQPLPVRNGLVFLSSHTSPAWPASNSSHTSPRNTWMTFNKQEHVIPRNNSSFDFNVLA